MSPLLVVVLLAAAVCVFCYVASLITKENSWVDRLWSIVPVVYVWVFAIAAGLADVRLDVMAGLVTLWGARLTFNFARKGGYSGMEDYRWAVLRGRMSRAQFAVFNLLFIVLYQNAILVLITLPALTAFENRTPFGPLDVRAHGAVPGAARRRDAGRSAAVGVPPAEGGRRRRGSRAGHAIPADRPLPLLAASELLLRAGAVVGALPVRRGRRGLAPAVDRARRRPAHARSSSGRRSSPRASRRSKYPEYADYQATTSAIVPWFPRRARQEAHRVAA